MENQNLAPNETMQVHEMLNFKTVCMTTETTSPEIRATLKKQLNDAINTHETISNYMMKKGYYHAYNLQEQYKVDMKMADTALNLTGGNS